MSDEAKRGRLDVYLPGGGGFRVEDGKLGVAGRSPMMEEAPLAGMDKRIAAHLVRRIMAETGLTILEVAAEPSQLPWGDEPRMCDACSTETEEQSTTVFHASDESCPLEAADDRR